MTRTLRTTFATLFLLCVFATPVRAAGPCDADRYRTRPAMGSTVVARRNAALTRCAARRWSVPGGPDKAVATFRCESSLWTWSHSGSNRGVAQQNINYWSSRARTYLHRAWFPQHWEHVVAAGWYKARANVLLSIVQVHRGGWSPWACG